MTQNKIEMILPLMKALHNDDFSTIDKLLSQGADVNLPYNHHGWTPFMWVCKEHTDPEIIKIFIDHGGDVNSKNKYGVTPLHIVAKHRSNSDIAELLIDAGANPDAQDNHGWTALMKAVSHPQAPMRKVLIRNLAENSDTSIKNNEGKTAYDLAKENAAFDDERLMLFLKPVDDLTEDEFHKIFVTFMGGDNE